MQECVGIRRKYMGIRRNSFPDLHRVCKYIRIRRNTQEYQGNLHRTWMGEGFCLAGWLSATGWALVSGMVCEQTTETYANKTGIKLEPKEYEGVRRTRKEYEGMRRNKKGYKGILGNTKEYKGIQRDTREYKVIQRKY